MTQHLGLGFLQQNDIGIGVAAEKAETLAIRGPVELEDAFRIEMGDLMSGTPIDGLNPDVIDPILEDRIGDELSIGSELHTFGNSRIGVEHSR